MSYDAEVLADAPLAYVKLDESPGATVAVDLGSAATNWTYSAAVVLGHPGVTADGGTSASNDSASGVPLASLGLAAPVPVPLGLSIEAWVDAGTNDQLAALMDGSDASGSLYALMTNAGVTGFGRYVVALLGFAQVASNAPLSPGPHHVVVTSELTDADGGVLHLYIDGVEQGTAATSVSLLTNISTADLGGQGASLPPTSDVLLDNAAIYDTCLTPARVLAHYTAGAAQSAILTARGATSVSAVMPAGHAAGRTEIRFPGLGSVESQGSTFVRVHPVVTLQAGTRQRAVGGVVLTMTTPAIVNGRPTVPKYWAQLGQSMTAIEGAKHIHAIKDPNPIWNPYTGGWFSPPPPVSKPWSARWSVNDLPDPAHYSAGYYWLGDASNADGTGSIQSAARQWNPDRSTPSAPAWHSAFPFKPSVTAANHFLQGGGIVHHPKGVNFNSHFIEHMWTVFPSSIKQPFSWVIAGMVASWPSGTYVHNLLDAGVDPATHGVHLSADACNSPHRLNGETSTRALIRVARNEMVMNTHHQGGGGGHTVRCRVTAQEKPCMFVGIFNGTKSSVGRYAPGSKKLQKGRLDADSTTHYILGRQNGWLDQNRASHLVLFEIRYWSHALSLTDLDAQYHQLSSTYQFDRYRNG